MLFAKNVIVVTTTIFQGVIYKLLEIQVYEVIVYSSRSYLIYIEK